MNSESFDNTDLTASNMSEISCGASLCLSTKEQYKVINRNQLTKLDFPLFRAGTTSIECGMSLMEEISDFEDEYENPYENNISKREKLKKILGEFKDKSKRGYSNLRRSISKIGTKMKMKLTSVKECKENEKSISRLTSSCTSIGRSRASLSLSKLKSLGKTQMISTSRKAKVHSKVSQVSNKASYKLNTKCSYISKRCVSFSTTIKSKIVYNLYKIRNIIGDKFPRRSSKFVLSFKKGSEDIEKKTMNCNHIPSNELIYDSVEYFSRNTDDIEEINMISNQINCNSNNSEEMDTNNLTILVNDRNSLINENVTQIESNDEVDENTPTTTINSFLRLSSMDSTTCTTIQNETNSNTPFPVMLSMRKVMEQMESLYQELIQLKNTNKALNNDDKIHSNFLPFEKDDMEIFSSMKELVYSSNKDLENEEEIIKKNDSDEETTNNCLNNITDIKQNQFRNDLVFTLLRQTLQYFENIKNSYLDSELKVKSTDNEQVKHLIISAIQKLKSSGNSHALEV